MGVGIFWFLFSVGLGVWASAENRNGFIWFVASAVLSPILTGIAFYIMVLHPKKNG